jgi:hypothetical protein
MMHASGIRSTPAAGVRVSQSQEELGTGGDDLLGRRPAHDWKN